MSLETDPKDFKLDANGDLDIGDDVSFVSGLDAVVQSTKLAMSLIRGELRSDLDAGIPYLERDNVPAEDAILGQKFDEARVLTIFREALLEVPDVTEIIELNVSLSATRTLTVSWRTRTVFGDTDLDTLEV